ncbi:MAG: PorV/PorQ family protein [bacterium]|nr:PorV/PorQ family protein [bacterium]
MKKMFLFLLLFISLSIALFADNISESGGQFLNLGIGAKAISLGEAYVASCDDVTSIYWNPAGVVFPLNKNVMFIHGSSFADITYDWLGYVHPTAYGGLGFAIQYINYGTLEKLDDEGNQLGIFHPADKVISVSYGHIFKLFAAGVTGKYIESVITKSASAYALDFGLQYSLTDFIQLGVVGRNYVSTKIKYKNVADELAKSLDFGISYFGLEGLLLELDIKRSSDEVFTLNTGVEYKTKISHFSEAAIRAGYNTRIKEVDGLLGISIGFGLKFKVYTIDYVYKPIVELGDTHFLSFGIEI